MKPVKHPYAPIVTLFLAIMVSQPSALAILDTRVPVSMTDTSDGSSNVAAVQTDNGVYEAFVPLDSYDESRYQQYNFDFALPDYENVIIQAVDMTFNWYEGKMDAAKLEFYDSVNASVSFDMTTTNSDNTEITYTPDAAAHIDSAADVNGMYIRFLADKSSGGGWHCDVDFVQVSVMYDIAVLVEPDLTTYSGVGFTRTYAHRLRNDNVAATLTLSAVSDQGWTTRIYHDLNGDGDLDTGEPQITTLGALAFEEIFVLVQVDIPSGAASGTEDITTLTVTNPVSSKSGTAYDTTIITGLGTVIKPDYSTNQKIGTTASYAHVVYNTLTVSDTIGLTAVADLGWTSRIYADTDMDGVKDNSTVIAQVIVAANMYTGIVVEVDVPTGESFIVNHTTVTATGTQNSETAVDTTQATLAEIIIDGVMDDMYLAPFAFIRFFNYGLDPNMASGELRFLTYNDVLYIYYRQHWQINDNTYGVNRHPSWGGQTHPFSSLVGSDHTEFVFYDESGDVRLQFYCDYISEVTPSEKFKAGYDCLGFSGGDGLMVLNNTPYTDPALDQMMEFACSAAYNVNYYTSTVGGTPIVSCPGGDVNLLETNPPIDLYYNVLCPNASEFQTMYAIEMSIPIDAFPEEPIVNIVARAHNSPAKVAEDTPQIPSSASIGDFVWYDWDADGIQDFGEPGIPDVRVWLFWDRNGDDAFTFEEMVGVTFTDGSGLYLFEGLPAGDFSVQVDETTIPGGFVRTTSYNPYILSDDIAGAARGALGPDEDCLTADFGYDVTGGVIGDFVWFDTDQDGIQDNGELGIGGVTVDLIDVATSTVIATTTTNSMGKYYFTGLSAGAYLVDVTDTAGVLTGHTKSDGPQSKPDPCQVAIPADGVYLDADFGYYTEVYGQLGDMVFWDLNWDTVYNGSDIGMDGVTLSIWKDVNGNGIKDTQDAFLGSTITNSAGVYGFSGLDVSTEGIQYIVQVTDAYNRLEGLSKFYPGAYLLSLLTTADPVDLDVDFPYVGAGIIGDRVWNDLNQNGIQDDGEPGIAGVTIEIYRGDLYAQTETNGTGNYLFYNLPPNDTYTVVVTDDYGILTGWSISPIGAGGDPALDSNDPSGSSTTLNNTNNFSDIMLDFGFYSNEVFGSIGNYIWNDDNYNGLQDEDPSYGLDNVTIELRDSEGHILGTDITSGGGYYSFIGLPVSPVGTDYKVVITDLNGVLTGSRMTTSPSLLEVTLTTAAPDVDTADAGFWWGTTAVISTFSAYNDSGRTVVRWETCSEVDTAGFFLLREDPGTGAYVPVHDQILTALIGYPQGGVYRFVDESADPADMHSYRLIEVESSGTRTFGPFTVLADGSAQKVQEQHREKPIAQQYDARPHSLPLEQMARLESRKEVASGIRQISGEVDSVRIGTRESGLVYLDAADIRDAYGSMAADPQFVENMILDGRLKLTSQGQELAWFTPDENPGSGICFYAPRVDSIYTNENVFFAGEGTSLLMQTITGEGPEPVSGDITFTDTVHFEEDAICLPAIFGDPEGDYWVWNSVTAGAAATTFDLWTDGIARNEMATLTVYLKGYTEMQADPDHHAVVNLNGMVIGEATWNGREPYTLTIQYIDQNIFNDGLNTLSVSGVLESGVLYSIFCLDSFEITYERRFEAVNDRLVFRADENPVVTVSGFTGPQIQVLKISDPADPVRVFATTIDYEGGTYRVSFVPESPQAEYLALTPDAERAPESVQGIRMPGLAGFADSADMIMISPAEFWETSQVYAEYRQSQGYSVQVYRLEDIFNTFSDGMYHPGAIRDFLAHAYQSWPQPPRYVFLVGNGTYDYRNIYGYNDNLIPVMMAATPHGLFASDNRFADVNADGLPDMIVGRLPILLEGELSAYLDKVRSFETGGGSWTTRAMLVADDPDLGGDFPTDSDALAALFPGHFEIEYVYLSEMPLSQARERIRTALDEGVCLLNYYGHGGLDRLAAEGLLTTRDVGISEGINNTDRLPVMTAMTCVVGNYAVPSIITLSEALLLKSGGGTIALWVPTGLSVQSLSRTLDEAFYNAVFASGQSIVGEAVNQAYGTSGVSGFMIDIYHLLGDPVIQLH